jgi:hypothetical protein
MAFVYKFRSKEDWDRRANQTEDDDGPFTGLCEQSRWLAWRSEERGGKSTKVPLCARNGRRASVTNTGDWTTREAAQNYALCERLYGEDGGIGIVLGELGDGKQLVGIDLDSSLGSEGKLALWAVPLIDTLDSYAEISPSGRGLKAFVTIATMDVRRFLDLIGAAADSWGTRRSIPGFDGADHGPGIELYAANRFFTVTGQVWDERRQSIAALDWPRLEALARLLPAPGAAQTNDNASGREGRDGSRSAKAWRAVLQLRAATYEEMCEALRSHEDPDIRAWVAEKGEPHDERELKRIWNKLTLPEGARLEEFWAVIEKHQYVFASNRRFWPPAAVNGYFPKVQVGTDDRGKPILIPASLWLDRNRRCEQVTWAPGQPMILEDKLLNESGWIEQPGVKMFNLYMPPMVGPGDPAKAAPWLDHIAKVYPDDHRHLVRWFAHLVQFPWEKINHAPLLGGPQGVGKDTLLAPVRHAVGIWNCQETNPQRILAGQFTGYLRAVLLRISEVKDVGEADRFKLYEHLKALTASPPETLKINTKYVSEYDIPNCLGVVLTTNHDIGGIYLPAEDRRIYVAWSPLTREDFAPDYWRTLWAWYKAGGLDHVAAYLRALDLSDFDPKAPPPQTPAFWQIVGAHQDPQTGPLADALDTLAKVTETRKRRLSSTAKLAVVPPLPAVTVRMVRRYADEELGLWLDNRSNSRVIPHRFKECGYVPVRNPDRKNMTDTSGMWIVNGRRQVVYALASLSPQERIAAARQLKQEADKVFNPE